MTVVDDQAPGDPPVDAGASMFDRLRARDPRAIARALTAIEFAGAEADALRRRLHALEGRARVVGFAGPPGVGKSTLVSRYVQELRARQRSVAVLAVDPSSPVSGGALLGDRTRMGCTTNDPGVFVRSVASRGHLGGLSLAVPSMLDVLDVAGFDDIIVEAVGAGQSEVEISRFVDTTVVLSAPGLGDDVQAIKAGILEVADVLVVHKADLPGSSETQRQLEAMLDLRDAVAVPEVLLVSAQTGSGLDRLVETIDAAHRTAHVSGGPQRRSTEVLRQTAAAEVVRRLNADPDLAALGAAFHRGELSLADAVQQLIERIVRHSQRSAS